MAVVFASGASAEWSSNPKEPLKAIPTGISCYGVDVRPCPDGGAWRVMIYVNTKNESGETEYENTKYEYRVQYFSPEGIATFEEPGLLVSDYKNKSMTMINDRIYVDSDGNAIVMVCDSRNGSGEYPDQSLTAYKITKTGEFLWGEDGVVLSDPVNTTPWIAQSNCVELEDHSYVFAWNNLYEESQYVSVQRLNNAGETQWNLKEMTLDDVVTSNPNLVASGDNTCILVYTRTASDVMYARKLDFEGSNVWGSDTRLYRGGWGSTPTHLQFKVTSSGDGGALVGLCTDQEGVMTEYPYLIYVDGEGKLPFSSISDNGDIRLTYDEFRALNIAVVPAGDGSGFYTVWRELMPGSDSSMGLNVQKVDKNGELLFGDNGMALLDMGEQSLSYISLQPTDDGGAVAFYSKYADFYDQQNFAVRINGEGEYVWQDRIIPVSAGGEQASDLETWPWPGNKSWLLTWSCGGSSEEDNESNIYMLRFNEDGTFGTSGAGVKSVGVNDGGSLDYNGDSLTGTAGAQVTVYNMAGGKVAGMLLADGTAKVNLPSGIYVASSEGKTVKFIVK